VRAHDLAGVGHTLAVGDGAGSCRAATIALGANVTGRSVASAFCNERFPGDESRQHEWNDATGDLRGNVVMSIIRVFPRKTSMTPTDGLAFVGDPPLGKQLTFLEKPNLPRPEADEVHVSVTFTWDKEEGNRLVDAWKEYYSVVKLGGPAITGSNGDFTPGKYIRHGVTFTSRGCPNRCPWCLVPEYEGPLRLLDIAPGYIIQDNNFLATPKHHRLAVYKMLQEQPRAAIFSGGLESRRVTDEIAEELRSIRIHSVFLAADTDAALKPLQSAVDRLAFLKLRSNKMRSYVMIGRNETIEQAEQRLEAVWEIGCMPFSQLYQPSERYIKYPRKWRDLNRKWSRPAAIRASHKK